MNTFKVLKPLTISSLSFLLLLVSYPIQAQSECQIRGGGKGQLECAKVYKIQQKVRLKALGRGINRFLKPAEKVSMFPNEILQTSVDSKAQLQFNEGSLAWTKANTVFEFNPGQRRIQLIDGAVLVMVAPGGQPINTRTAEVDIRPKGTVYLVEHNQTEKKTTISVLTDNPQGPVTVVSQTNPNESIKLYSGQRVSATEQGFGPIENFDLSEMYKTEPVVAGLGVGQTKALSGQPPEARETLDSVRQETVKAQIGQTIKNSPTQSGACP